MAQEQSRADRRFRIESTGLRVKRSIRLYGRPDKSGNSRTARQHTILPVAVAIDKMAQLELALHRRRTLRNLLNCPRGPNDHRMSYASRHAPCS